MERELGKKGERCQALGKRRFGVKASVSSMDRSTRNHLDYFSVSKYKDTRDFWFNEFKYFRGHFVAEKSRYDHNFHFSQ